MPTFPRQDLLRKIDLDAKAPDELRHTLGKQWLLTNGLGGYASGTIAGAVTWRYHGLLVAALPAPLGRRIMLNQLEEAVIGAASGGMVTFGGIEPAPGVPAAPPVYLRQFRLENQLPVWRYEIGDLVIEKRVVMPYLQNSVHITYELLGGPAHCDLVVRPLLEFRGIDHAPAFTEHPSYPLRASGRRIEVEAGADCPPLRLHLDAADGVFTYDGGSQREAFYGRDAARGFEARGTLWTPGLFTFSLRLNQPVTLIASTEEWRIALALTPEEARVTERERRDRLLRIADPAVRCGSAAELVLAADQFVINPVGRDLDAARARAAGDELRSVIAGYHWFTDWGRDTMISLEGLTLTTGRYAEAAWILRTFARYVREGLIPNLFPEGRNEGLYHTADATLWFFHAADRYLKTTRDRDMLSTLLPVMDTIIEQHLRGTRFGIGVDPQDGLLRQGEQGYQLTWMDAKVGDWVVTPRRGKAVEINALWYNALRLYEGWLLEVSREQEALAVRRHADRAQASFNARFWNPATGCLYDVLDGEKPADPAVRPNQILALSLSHPVLDPSHWRAVLDVVEKELLTPVGLRSLSRSHPDFKASYSGDLRARDAAYHQGTVWAWLIGPFIDAWRKVHPDDATSVRRFLEGFRLHLDEGCVGSISEIFDAEPPYAERGCIAQAWSVAEVLRSYAATGAPTGAEAHGVQEAGSRSGSGR